MKVIQEIALTVFSIIMLVISIMTTVLILGWVDFGIIEYMIEGIVNNSNAKTIVLTLNVFFIFIAIVSIFYDSEKGNTRDGVLLENEKGNLLISRTALTKIINSVINDFENVKVNGSRIILDNEGMLNINVQISVTKDVVIKEITNNLQIKIKEAIKNSSDLDVKTVNVAIQSIIESPKEES